jgi:ABC-type thiamin/hydroxymethylpyrimidine transport system permease subunit
MNKNYIEESILISVFTVISLYVYQMYRLTYLSNEPPYNIGLLVFPLIIAVAFTIIFSNKKSDN